MPQEKVQQTLNQISETGYLPSVEKEESYFTEEQMAELKKLEFEYQKATLGASILEQRYKIKQLQEVLNGQRPVEKKSTRTETDY